MKKLISRHGDTLIGVAVVAPFVVFAIWLLSPIDLPYRSIGIFITALAFVVIAINLGEWLQDRNSEMLKLMGLGVTTLGLLMAGALALAVLAFVIWTKLNAPPSACMQCD